MKRPETSGDAPVIHPNVRPRGDLDIHTFIQFRPRRILPRIGLMTITLGSWPPREFSPTTMS